MVNLLSFFYKNFLFLCPYSQYMCKKNESNDFTVSFRTVFASFFFFSFSLESRFHTRLRLMVRGLLMNHFCFTLIPNKIIIIIIINQRNVG